MHPDVFVGQTACWWLERYNGNEPFFLQIGLPGPHPPYDPTQEYLDLYKDANLPKAIREDYASQPAPLQALRQNHLDNDNDAVVHLEDASDEQLHNQRAHYYANVTMIDAQVGHVVDALEKRGVLDNTIIIFTTDHGDCLNDHGHSQKWNMYESSVHIPAVVWAPNKIKAGTKIDQLVSLMDFGPTILEYASVDVPEWMEALSLASLLDGKSEERKRVFAEHSNDAILTETDFMTMVREDKWKLVHFVDCPEGQLFDLDSDPNEVNNLWDDPKHAEKRAQLITAITN